MSKIPDWARAHLPSLEPFGGAARQATKLVVDFEADRIGFEAPPYTPQPRVLVRWFDEPSADALRDDGTGNFDLNDFATLSSVFVTDSVDNAKLIIQQSLIKDELIYEGDEPVTDHNQPWVWSQPVPSVFVWWTLSLRGDVVVSARIEPIDVLQPDGGPE